MTITKRSKFAKNYKKLTPKKAQLTTKINKKTTKKWTKNSSKIYHKQRGTSSPPTSRIPRQKREENVPVSLNPRGSHLNLQRWFQKHLFSIPFSLPTGSEPFPIDSKSRDGIWWHSESNGEWTGAPESFRCWFASRHERICRYGTLVSRLEILKKMWNFWKKVSKNLVFLLENSEKVIFHILARNASHNRALLKLKIRDAEKNRHFSKAFRWSAVVRTVPR